MPSPQPLRVAILALLLALALAGARAPKASAINALKPICGVAGMINGIAGKACGVLAHGKALLGGGASSGGGNVGSRAAAAIGLAAVVAWVLGGAKSALHATATVLDRTTRPQLTTTWFSSTYWRMAGIAALLTLPFLFAAAVQALIHSDVGLLARASLGYLPLSLLAVGVAAPLTMLLLAASDEISAAVSAAAGGAGTRFLDRLGLVSGTLSVLTRSPFVAFFVGLLTVSAAVLLWVEMLMREAAVYIVVLMLPLAFAALVWPARRVWAIRVVELLVALILSKFAIVAVLALGGAALGQRGAGGVGGMLAGLVLVALACAAPWALVRLLPMTEVASAAAGQFRGEGGRIRAVHGAVDSAAGPTGDWAGAVMAGMRGQARDGADASLDDGVAQGEAAKPTPGGRSSGIGEDPPGDRLSDTARRPGAGKQSAAGTPVGAGADSVAGTPVGVVAADGAGATAGAPPPGTDAEARAPSAPDLMDRIRGAAGPMIELGPEAHLPTAPRPSPQPESPEGSSGAGFEPDDGPAGP